MQAVSDRTLQTELDRYSNTIVIVDYWAPWCAPCKQLEKVLSSLEEEFGYTVLKVNIDENPVLAQEKTAVPQLDFYRNNELLKSHIGAMTRRQLIQLLDSLESR